MSGLEPGSMAARGTIPYRSCRSQKVLEEDKAFQWGLEVGRDAEPGMEPKAGES